MDTAFVWTRSPVELVEDDEPSSWIEASGDLAPTSGGPDMFKSVSSLWLIQRDRDSPEIYHPLVQHTGLYREFISMTPTPEQACSFASRYGMLGVGSAREFGNESSYAEPWAAWKSEAEFLRVAEDLRVAFSTRSFENVERFISPDGSFRLQVTGHLIVADSHELAALSANKAPDYLPMPLGMQTVRSPNSMVRAVGEALQFLVNLKLKASSVLVWSDAGRTLRLQRKPDNLLSAMWLQFAKAVEGNKTYAECAHCRKEFEIASSEGSRRDKKYCSNSCRARACQLRANKRDVVV
jgi:hypothetical protein